MIRNVPIWRAAAVAAILVVLVSLFGILPALAARDRTPPTKPTNLRVTGTAPSSVSLAWNPSTDNSGLFSYRTTASNGYSMSAPQTATTSPCLTSPMSAPM